MADVLRIKRRAVGGAAGPPASLAASELAFNEQDSTLYYGGGNNLGLATSIFAIAGAGVSTSTAPLMDGVAAPGTLTTFSRGDHVHPVDVSRAPLVSPTFTGVPAAPTAAPGTNTTQLATTAFAAAAAAASGVQTFNTRSGAVTLTNGDVIAVLPGSSTAPVMNGVATVGTLGTWAHADHVHPSDTSRFATSGGPLSGGISFGNVLGASTIDLSKHIALWGTTYGFGITSGQLNIVSSGSAIMNCGPAQVNVNGTLAVSGAMSVAGTASGPTAAPGTNNTQLATTAFVQAAAAASGVQTFNTRAGAVTLALADVTGAGGAPIASPTFTGTATVSGLLSGSVNLNAALPTNNPSGFSIAWNYTGGQGETDFFNHYLPGPATNGAFNFHQYQTGTTALMAASISKGGNLTLAGTLNATGAQFPSGGINFGSTIAASTIDLSKHIELWSTTYGFNVTANRLNYVTLAGASHIFVGGTADILQVGTAGYGSSIVAITSAAVYAPSSLMAGNNTTTGQVAVNGPLNSARWLAYETNASARWLVGVTNDGETGTANAGATFQILRESDTAAVLGTPFAITRSNGNIALGEASATVTVGGALAVTGASTFTGIPTAPTAAPGTNTTQIATTAFATAAAAASGVQTFNTRAGAVTLALADVTGAGGAPLASPTFTGLPQATYMMVNGSGANSAQGSYFMWNRTGGTGAAFFVNNRGLGGGGFQFIDTNGTTDVPVLTIAGSTGGITANVNLTAAGNLTVNGNIVGGLTFGSVTGASSSDLSKGIALFSTTFGFGITSARLNYVTPATSSHVFVSGTTDVATIASGGLTIPGTLAVTGATTHGAAITTPGITLTATPNSLVSTAVNAGMELGSQTTANTPYIDFHSSGSALDYDARILASAGNTGTVGLGTLTVTSAQFTVSGNFSNPGNIVGGLTFGSLTGASSTDLSKHIALYGTIYGMSVTGGTLNLVANGAATLQLTSAGGAVNGTLTTTGTAVSASQGNGTITVVAGTTALTVAQVLYDNLYLVGSPASAVTLTLPVATTVRRWWHVQNTASQPVTFQGTSGGTIVVPNGGFRGIWTDGAGVYSLENTFMTASAGGQPLLLSNNQYVRSNNAPATASYNLIGLNSSNVLILGDTGITTAINVFSNYGIVPYNDAIQYLGGLSNRWNAVYASNGTIQTSDPHEKKNMAAVPSCIDLVQKIEPGTFEWTDESIDRRTHWGFDADNVHAVMAGTGIDFGGYVEPEPGEPGTKGLNYAEMVPILWKAVQELTAEVARLKAGANG